MTDRPISISQFTVPRWGLGELLVALSQVEGVDGIGLWPERFDGIQTPGVHRLLRDAELRASSLSFIPDFANDERGSVIRGHHAIDQARELGSPTLIVHALPAQGTLTDAARLAIHRSLQAIGDHAERSGVLLALDAVHADGSESRSPGVDLEQALDLVQGINHAALVLDTWNTGWDPRLAAKIHRAIGWIGLVQLRECDGSPHDARTRPAADGALPLERIVQHVQAEGYVGWYEIDAGSDRVSPEQYASFMRQCLRTAQRVLGVPQGAAVASMA